MFDRLAASLSTAFNIWFPMFDQVQTFSSNILRYKQMFDLLASLSHKACRRAGKSNQSQAVFLGCHVIILAGIHSKRSVSLFIRCLIKHCLVVKPLNVCRDGHDVG